MTSWSGAIPYFTEDELACQGSGIIKLDIRFAARLPALRAAWNAPLIPTSVCRTPAHNKAINNGRGGHPRSLHLTENPFHPTNGTMASDFWWEGWDTETKLRFARLAYRMGWSVGLHNTFGHIDRRADIGLRKRVFLYGEWSGAFSVDEVL